MPDSERRLAAIMYTDMVGYTALTQKSEALAQQLLEMHRSIVRPFFPKHDGREVKTMGDAFLVEFASALEAVRCAFDIQQSMHELNQGRSPEKQIQLRIGVHVGDIIHRENDVYGDAVNVASRIYPLAAPGGVCISQPVYEHVKNKLEFAMVSLGKKDLKNVREPTEVFKVTMPWEQPVASEAVGPPLSRVAVLPFASYSPDPQDDYFSDGMTEEVISTLSKVRGLEVISRTSVMQYKNKPRSIPDIGRELKVGTLMEGSVRKAGERVRITVQLIEAGSDKHLWVENFDRDLRDVFAVQSEVAEKVAASLQIRLTEDDKVRIEKGGTTNVEAHTLYLKGNATLSRYNKNAIESAIAYFEQALGLDSDYALAYCGLANAYSFLALIEAAEPTEAYRKAEQFAQKALALDSTLAEAHAALQGPLMNKYDFKGVEEELKKAIALNPNLAEAYCWLSWVYLLTGRREESMKAVERAVQLDPFSVQTSTMSGTMYLYSGQSDEAIKHFQNALELDPSNTLSLDNLGLAHIQKGLIEEGLEEVKRAFDKGFSFASDLAYAYVKAGKVEEARQLLAQFQGPGEGKHVPPTIVAGIHAVLGENERALEWLERAYNEHSGYLPWVMADFVFENIRNEPRFLLIAKRMGLG